LAIDWDYHQLRIVAATVRAGKLQIEQAALWQEEQNPNLAEAEALGQRFREHLRSAGIAPAPVLACVGRDRIILREVRYPAVAAGEEPAVIRFQVMKELTDSADDVIIDYTPLGDAPPGEERRALVLTVRRELLGGYQALCKAAGLKLLALTPRPFGTLACLRESLKKWEGNARDGSSAQAAVALLTPADNWAEFCLVRDDTVVVARSLPAGPALAGEVRRNIAMYSAQSPRHTVSSLYLAGNGENGALQDSLQQLLAIPVRSFDPLIDVEGAALAGQDRGAFAGAVGLLRAQAAGRPLPINFVSPKQPRAARDPNKQRLALIGGLAAFLLIGVVSYCYAQFAALDREIEDLTLQFKNNQITQMPQVEQVENRFQALSAWDRTNICWLDEFYDLTALMPSPNAIQLSEIIVETQPVTRDKDKPVTRMELKGFTTRDNVIVGLRDRVADEKGHYVPGHFELSRVTGTEIPAPFTQRFTAKIDVEKPAPGKPRQRLTGPFSLPQPPERSSPREPVPTGLLPGGIPKKVAAPEGAHVYVLPATSSPIPSPTYPRGIPNRSSPAEGGFATPAPASDFQNRYKQLMEQRHQAPPVTSTTEGTPRPPPTTTEVPRSGEMAVPAVKKGKSQ
jgi:Tfp pilus assembly PilM family ATPase